MRQVLAHCARTRDAKKRGGDFRRVSLNESVLCARQPDADLIELDDALKALAQIDPRKAHIVELRFFGGLSLEETAAALKLSADTVWRDWDMAKCWLYREMRYGAK